MLSSEREKEIRSGTFPENTHFVVNQLLAEIDRLRDGYRLHRLQMKLRIEENRKLDIAVKALEELSDKIPRCDCMEGHALAQEALKQIRDENADA